MGELIPASQNNKKWIKISKEQIVIEKCIYVFRRLRGLNKKLWC